MCPPEFRDVNHRYWNHALSAPLAAERCGFLFRTQGSCHDQVEVSAPVRPLGEATARLPSDLARTLEYTFVSLKDGDGSNSVTLQAGLQHIRQGDAADGQPWPGNNRTRGQRLALARIDRANAGLSFPLELLHATERVRVDGDIDPQMGDGAREGLLLACRGLAEYVDVQLQAA